jgi:hypothetical protein
VPRGLHSLVPTTVRSRRTALVTAALVTALAVGTGVASQTRIETPAATATTVAATTPVTARSGGSVGDAGLDVSSRIALDDRTDRTTRSFERVPLSTAPTRVQKRWTTSRLDLRIQPAAKAKVAGTIKPRVQLQLTGNRRAGFAEVVDGRSTRWVTASYLAKDKPAPPKPTTGVAAGLSDAPCPDGSGIEAGLQPASVKVYRAVCAAFPVLSAYGGQDGHGEHVNGEAIDFMVPSHEIGEQVKDFVYAHRSELDLFDIIWSQHIWTIERAGEGFRSMSDRGSDTANHFDHVHIKIN